MLGTVFTVLAIGALIGLIVYLFIIEPRSKYHDSHGLWSAATLLLWLYQRSIVHNAVAQRRTVIVESPAAAAEPAPTP